MFPHELERDAFRAINGEFAWTRVQIPTVVSVLRSHGIGILGGELWWVRDGSIDWEGAIPHQHGAPGVYHWETQRKRGESWPHFIERGASETLAAVERWPSPSDIPRNLPGRILYNLAWVTEAQFKQIGTETF